FSDYSAAGQSVHSLYLAFPLLIISTIVIVTAIFPLTNVPDTMKADGHIVPDYSSALRAACGAAFILTLLQIILPIISFVPYLAVFGADSVSVAGELWNSCLIGAVAVLLMMIPSALMALMLTNEGMLCKPIVWIIAILPLSVPGVLTGIGVLGLFSSTPLYILRTGVLLPAIGLTIRYIPFSMLIQYGCYLRIDKERIRAAKLLQPSSYSAFIKVRLPMMAPGLMISGIVVFLLTLGDVGTSLVLMSAGREPMSVKIYNYLHYGSSEKVTLFCLIQMTVCLLLMGVVYFATWLLKRKRDIT
ncbi:MAG: hypothetical protein IKP31_00845, partial [Lachnospiraceae bacterium]|nr:hypothetical protein [Lachnospiraceae bacterium]